MGATYSIQIRHTIKAHNGTIYDSHWWKSGSLQLALETEPVVFCDGLNKQSLALNCGSQMAALP